MLLVADTTIEGRPTMSDKAGEMNIAAVAIAIVKARRTRFFIFLSLLEISKIRYRKYILLNIYFTPPGKKSSLFAKKYFLFRLLL